MQPLLALSRSIDRVTAAIGRSVAWLIVLAALISAGNAVVRKLFDASSNGWLELQWWLFGLVFLLASPWTLASNEHVRIDIVSSRLSIATRHWIDVIGIVFFLMPICLVLLVTSWPFAIGALPTANEIAQHAARFEFWRLFDWLGGLSALGDQSSNAGGLPTWPIKLLIPLAFAILLVQAASELIKRAAILRGDLAEAAHDRSYHDTVIEMPERRDGS